MLEHLQEQGVCRVAHTVLLFSHLPCALYQHRINTAGVIAHAQADNAAVHEALLQIVVAFKAALAVAAARSTAEARLADK
jgi:hypothetical protein